MPPCPVCAQEILDQAAKRCPHCGATPWRNAATHPSTGVATYAETREDGAVASRAKHDPLAPAEDARFPPGRIFASRYRIVSLLGYGATGEVYRADDLKLGQPVALKLLCRDGARTPSAIERFVREVRLARGIAHPNVCRVYDIGDAEGWHYLSMEYVDGETLASLLRRIGRLPREKALDIAKQLCAGLGSAHDRGVLHRDLKPANIMLDGRGRVRIMDFGLAVPSSEGRAHETAVGTPAYMAPEQFVGAGVSEQTDIYALGLVLYELFVGRGPFTARTLEERFRAAFSTGGPVLAPDLELAIADVIEGCLKRDPAERPSSALAVASALPGDDSLTAAVAAGRILAPDIVAASSKATLRPVPAWSLFAAIIGGAALVASQGHILTVSPADVPKPPEVLAERATDILARIGAVEAAVDREFWFQTAGPATDHAITFVYRQSPRYLVPVNTLHAVTETDPPADVAGMSTVVLDGFGRLLRLSRLPTRAPASAPERHDWTILFEEAGLAERDFTPAIAEGGPLTSFDQIAAWTGHAGARSVRVTAAARRGAPVFFEIADLSAASAAPANVYSTGRNPWAEVLFWALLASGCVAIFVVARRNLRAGEGDRSGAMRIAVFVFVAGLLISVLQAHHVPLAVDELIWLFNTVAWSLLWAAFAWLVYIGFEPYVRRLWPGTLIAWTRLLSGHIRDPLIGREVLIGTAAGVLFAAGLIVRLQLRPQPAPDQLVFAALIGLRSARRFTSIVSWAVLEGVLYALATVFFLMLLRLIFRRTWIAALLLAVIVAPLVPGVSSPADVAFSVPLGLVVLAVLMRGGLVSLVALNISERLLTRLPLTLQLNAWFLGASLMSLLLIGALAVYGLTTTLTGRPTFGRESIPPLRRP